MSFLEYFSKFSSESEELKKIIDNLRNDINILNNKIYNLTRENEKLLDDKNKFFSKITDADTEIDFPLLNPFSIERYTDSQGRIATSFGYFVIEDNMKLSSRTWYIYCTEERHQKYVDQFREYISSKNKN